MDFSGCNPDPIVKDENAVCCHECDEKYVMPARVKQIASGVRDLDIIGDCEEMFIENLAIVNGQTIYKDENHYITLNSILKNVEWLTDLWSVYPERMEKYLPKSKLFHEAYLVTLCEIAESKAKRGAYPIKEEA